MPTDYTDHLKCEILTFLFGEEVSIWRQFFRKADTFFLNWGILTFSSVEVTSTPFSDSFLMMETDQDMSKYRNLIASISNCKVKIRFEENIRNALYNDDCL